MKKKNLEIELGILRTLVWDREDLITSVPEEVFKFPTVVDVFKYVAKALRENKRIPDFKTVQALFPNSDSVIEELVDNDPNPEESEFYTEELRKRWTEVLVLDFDPEGCQGFYDQIESVKTLTSKSVTKGKVINFLSDTPSTYFDEVDLEVIPTGIDGLDSMMKGGGIMRGSLGVILSLPKRFKTGMLVNLGATAMLFGQRVLFVSLEVPGNEINHKFEHRLFRRSFLDMDPAKASKMMENLRGLGADLRIFGGRPNSLSIPELDEMVDEYRPDLLLVDYADILKPSTKHTEFRHTISELYLDLKAISEKYRAATWTVSLANRKGVGRKTIREDNAGEDFRKTAHCDHMVSINQTDEEAEANVARLVMVANRWGPQNGVVYVEIDYSTMTVREIDMEV